MSTKKTRIAALAALACVVVSGRAWASECGPDLHAPLAVVERVCGAIIADKGASVEDQARAYRRRGYGRTYDGRRPQDGYADYTTALALGPSVSPSMRSQLYRLRSEANAMLNNPQSAFNDANAAIETDPANADAHYQLGLLHLRSNNTALGIKSMDAAVSLKSDHVPARLNRARRHVRAEQFERVIDDTSVVLALPAARLERLPFPDPQGRTVTQRTAAVAMHAAALGYLQRTKEAEALFNEYVQDRPTAEVYRSRADFYLYTPYVTNIDNARDDYQRALKLDPDDHNSWYGFAVTLQSAKRTDEAVTAISIAIDRLPSQNGLAAQYTWEKASILRSAGRSTEAIETISSAWAAHIAAGDFHHVEHYVSILTRSGFLTARKLDIADPASRPIAAALAGCMRDLRCS